MMVLIFFNFFLQFDCARVEQCVELHPYLMKNYKKYCISNIHIQKSQYFQLIVKYYTTNIMSELKIENIFQTFTIPSHLKYNFTL